MEESLAYNFVSLTIRAFSKYLNMLEKGYVVKINRIWYLVRWNLEF